MAKADDFYMKGTSPRTLVEMGFELFSVEPISGGDYESKKVIYTFIKEDQIVSCRVHLETSRYRDKKQNQSGDFKLYVPTRCFHITNVNQDSFYRTGNE